ncbi:amidohydrolase family protein [Actinomadura opuntiae]|uniref:amidohydrolase family protein n=1 Tax=Actinomadura sp. OS1-43 TaxID=604315 RepID=UPI00255AB914|nr:amidohydrolase family protein [Actinomadura sp. OS1-43]MDL4821790.1 amidohydrolase family protein [Actinomadura sp. OS1-43]
MIGADETGAEVVDAAGGVLLPGLIDAHIHLHDRGTLEQLCAHGVTTGLDMGTWPPERLAALRGVAGLTDIRSAGTPAIGPGGPHSRIPGRPADAVLDDPGKAARFVADQVAQGSDYIKIVLEAPGEGGPDQAAADALVVAAHTAAKKVVAHASSPGAFRMALDAGADVITHVPLGLPLDDADVTRMASQGSIAVPTLTMMEGIAAAVGKPETFDASVRSVALLHRASVPIQAGTDANTQTGVPFQPAHGSSIHRELELLVQAGLSTAEALRAATSLPARHFGLTDRGAIEPGLRADLLLIDGDPLGDISATRNIRRVWCNGTEHAPRQADR